MAGALPSFHGEERLRDGKKGCHSTGGVVRGRPSYKNGCLLVRTQKQPWPAGQPAVCPQGAAPERRDGCLELHVFVQPEEALPPSGGGGGGSCPETPTTLSSHFLSARGPSTSLPAGLEEGRGRPGNLLHARAALGPGCAGRQDCGATQPSPQLAPPRTPPRPGPLSQAQLTPIHSQLVTPGALSKNPLPHPATLETAGWENLSLGFGVSTQPQPKEACW